MAGTELGGHSNELALELLDVDLAQMLFQTRVQTLPGDQTPPPPGEEDLRERWCVAHADTTPNADGDLNGRLIVRICAEDLGHLVTDAARPGHAAGSGCRG